MLRQPRTADRIMPNTCRNHSSGSQLWRSGPTRMPVHKRAWPFTDEAAVLNPEPTGGGLKDAREQAGCQP
jgi:hypothetical protein